MVYVTLPLLLATSVSKCTQRPDWGCVISRMSTWQGRGLSWRSGRLRKSLVHKHTSVVINHTAAFHLFPRQSDHVQWSVHEAPNQSLRSVLGGDDVVHPMVCCDVLEQTASGSIKCFIQDIHVKALTLYCNNYTYCKEFIINVCSSLPFLSRFPLVTWFVTERDFQWWENYIPREFN